MLLGAIYLDFPQDKMITSNFYNPAQDQLDYSMCLMVTPLDSGSKALV